MLTKTPDILTIFRSLSDPRQANNVDHLLSDMLVIALCGAICGVVTGCADERPAAAADA